MLFNSINGDSQLKIVCFGDSITGVYYHTGGRRAYADMLEIALKRIYPEASITIVNSGGRNATMREALERIQTDVLAHEPDLVIVNFGMNDVVWMPLEEFRANMIDIIKLKTRYPQGAEKMIIYSLTGRKVPAGGLPSDVGCVVMNVNTISFIANHIKTGMPLIEKRITVDGGAVKEPGNVFALIGTPINELIDFCGGFTQEPEKIIMGGPMMGVSQYDINAPVLKYTNAILAFTAKEADCGRESACIRCSKCVEVCPMELLPFAIDFSFHKEQTHMYDKLQVDNCIECGSCSYVCPSKRYLVQSIRAAKYQKRKGSKK